MIKVKPEGRNGVWIAQKGSVVNFLIDYKEDFIHNFLPSGPAIVGADWDKDSVIEKVKSADKIAILTGKSFEHNLKHALAVISGDKLYMYDIGEITVTDLEIFPTKD